MTNPEEVQGQGRAFRYKSLQAFRQFLRALRSRLGRGWHSVGQEIYDEENKQWVVKAQIDKRSLDNLTLANIWTLPNSTLVINVTLVVHVQNNAGNTVYVTFESREDHILGNAILQHNLKIVLLEHQTEFYHFSMYKYSQVAEKHSEDELIAIARRVSSEKRSIAIDFLKNLAAGGITDLGSEPPAPHNVESQPRPAAKSAPDIEPRSITGEELFGNLPPGLQSKPRQKYVFPPELLDSPEAVKAAKSIANARNYRVRANHELTDEERTRARVAESFLKQVRTRRRHQRAQTQKGYPVPHSP